MRQYVKEYEIIEKIPQGDYKFDGGSVAQKNMIFHCVDNTKENHILDIGFGLGQLGIIIKSNNSTAHWQVDGIDGYQIACFNEKLFEGKYYRNIWHGMAQDIPAESIKKYDVICLLDVIEHLNIDSAKFLLFYLLLNLRNDSLLFISTPLYFLPQASTEDDLEEHLIGVPASSMMALQPLMYSTYATPDLLVGSFIYAKKSLDYLSFFQPTDDRDFNIEKGYKIAKSVGMNLSPNLLIKCPE